MRLVVQRVTNSTVRVKGNTVGKIDAGVLVLVGIKRNDSEEQAESLANKLAKLRIMPDKNGKMNLSLSEAHAQVLAVSQFTLYANTNDGNRPSFIDAEEPGRAKELYALFVSKLQEMGLVVETGSFGEYMNISANLDGPVTIILEL